MASPGSSVLTPMFSWTSHNSFPSSFPPVFTLQCSTEDSYFSLSADKNHGLLVFSCRRQQSYPCLWQEISLVLCITAGIFLVSEGNRSKTCLFQDCLWWSHDWLLSLSHCPPMAHTLVQRVLFLLLIARPCILQLWISSDFFYFRPQGGQVFFLVLKEEIFSALIQILPHSVLQAKHFSMLEGRGRILLFWSSTETQINYIFWTEAGESCVETVHSNCWNELPSGLCKWKGMFTSLIFQRVGVSRDINMHCMWKKPQKHTYHCFAWVSEPWAAMSPDRKSIRFTYTEPHTFTCMLGVYSQFL